MGLLTAPFIFIDTELCSNCTLNTSPLGRNGAPLEQEIMLASLPLSIVMQMMERKNHWNGFESEFVILSNIPAGSSHYYQQMERTEGKGKGERMGGEIERDVSDDVLSLET